MEPNAFAPLAILQFLSSSRLLASACCPDKDLVALVSRLGSKDRLSLWNSSHGSKVWEVDVSNTDESAADILGLAWSPDGQSVAVAHDPPQITFHSLQDGRKQLTLPVATRSRSPPCHIVGVWWFGEEKSTNNSVIPDIFKRNGIVTGTAHAILKTLPLLDSLQEDSQKLTATDLFAFQGSQTRAIPKSLLPDVINIWPTLPPDPIAASIGSSINDRSSDPGRGIVDEVDNSNLNSILAVADNLGHIHYFLDGSFPLGSISLDSALSTMSLLKRPKHTTFFAHPCISSSDAKTITISPLQPVVIHLPLLQHRQARDLARLSSTARDLVFYTMRVVKEMRAIWFGSEAFRGARELGPKWVQALETKQKDQFGQEEPNSILDLTTLLVTGRASDSLVDFLGSGEQMSERGIQKWESTVMEALIKLRDFSEKRVGPACQRLYLVLEEVQGWSKLPQYAPFELSTQDLDNCLDLTSRAIVLSAWLAAVARRELSRFKEFIAWLRYETSVANPTNDNAASARHDILEVNNYLISGLVVSSIDKWFMGPVPQFSPRDLGVPDGRHALLSTIERARVLVNDASQMAWRANVPQADLNHLDRNLDALIQEMAVRCQRVFDRAAGAASRSAIISFSRGSMRDIVSSGKAATRPNPPLNIRERTIMLNEGHDVFQYLATRLPSGQNMIYQLHPHNTVCLARLRFGDEVSESPLEVGVALLECCLPGEGEGNQVNLDLLAADFFDDECVVIVYRLRNSKDKPAYIATLTYNDLGYQGLQADGYVNIPSREDLMLEAMEYWKEGHLPSARIPIKRCRALAGCKIGAVSLALNGRPGRRVACVLDDKGTTMECFDLEGEGDDLESDGGAP